MPVYKHDGPVDCTAAFDASNVRGKLAIVTGGRIPLLGPALISPQKLILIKGPMDLARLMSGPSNPLGELLALLETTGELVKLTSPSSAAKL